MVFRYCICCKTSPAKRQRKYKNNIYCKNCSRYIWVHGRKIFYKARKKYKKDLNRYIYKLKKIRSICRSRKRNKIELIRNVVKMRKRRLLW